jgi:hypothetical protein
MFSIFKKSSTITLDCFTVLPELPELFPIVRAGEILPSWWKSLEPTANYKGIDRGTMKMCPGVSDYFKAGFIIPSWRDFKIEINSGIPNVLPEGSADIHNPVQWGKALDGYGHVKLVSPWRIKEKSGVSFLFTNTFWHKHRHQCIVPNGVVNYKYQATTNVNILISKNAFPKEFVIDAGEPLVHCLPMSDQKLKIKMHVVSPEEYMQKDSYHFSFAGNYYKSKKILEGKTK